MWERSPSPPAAWPCRPGCHHPQWPRDTSSPGLLEANSDEFWQNTWAVGSLITSTHDLSNQFDPGARAARNAHGTGTPDPGGGRHWYCRQAQLSGEDAQWAGHLAGDEHDLCTKKHRFSAQVAMASHPTSDDLQVNGCVSSKKPDPKRTRF